MCIELASINFQYFTFFPYIFKMYILQSNGIRLRKLFGWSDLSSCLMSNSDLYSKFRLKSVVEMHKDVFQELKSSG